MISLVEVLTGKMWLEASTRHRKGSASTGNISSGRSDKILFQVGLTSSELKVTVLNINSRTRRRNPLSTKDIHEKLHIEGYHIILPQSWYSYDQARVIAYVRDGVQLKEKKVASENFDLPSISVELGLKKEKRTCFNFYYR